MKLALAFLAVALLPEARRLQIETFPELGLTIALPDLEGLQVVEGDDEGLVKRWEGKLGELAVTISFFAVPSASAHLYDPRDVVDTVESNVEQEGARAFAFPDTNVLRGGYGFAPYAGIGWGHLRSKVGERVSSLYCLGGLLQDKAYSIEIECEPAADDAAAGAFLTFFEEGIRYSGPTWDPSWTDEEALARWELHCSYFHDEMEEPRRTKHFIFLTNSSGGKLFAKKMEECYEAIKKVFPFEELEGQRLMPVFLFRTDDQYFQFMASITGGSIGDAERTAGHAWRDYYATWYEAPNDPVHIHETTHQIFGNRLRLGGGGSWFQEGVAEYIETDANERGNAARLVKKNRHCPLREFVTLESLIYSTSGEDVKGGSEAGDLYKQAALLIEFLRESKFGKERFMDFIRAIGRTPSNDADAIDEALLKVYEVDLVRLDELFVEYCKKR